MSELHHLHKRTAAGATLSDYVARRLTDLRSQLESLTCSEDDARALRGRIAELKKLGNIVETGEDTL